MRATGRRLICEPAQRTQKGILITQASDQDAYREAIVLDVGVDILRGDALAVRDGAKDEGWIEIKPGDHILHFWQGSGCTPFPDYNLISLDFSMVLCVLEDSDDERMTGLMGATASQDEGGLEVEDSDDVIREDVTRTLRMHESE